MNHIILMKEAIDYIEDNLKMDLSVKNIAERVHISSYYFQRIFQALTGFTVKRYIRNRRLSEAATELTSTSKSLLEIAVDFEYGSHEAFTRAFQSHYGFTPLRYRKVNPPVTLCHKIEVKSLDIEEIDIRCKCVTLDQQNIFGCVYKTNMKKREYFKDIPNFYHEFGSNKRYADILGRINPAYSYGVVYGEEEFLFLVGEKTNDFNQMKKDYHHITIPSGQYAEFQVTGTIKEVQSTWRWIYAYWFDHSKYVRDSGYDFEVIDVIESKYPSEMKVNIYIPIRKVDE